MHIRISRRNFLKTAAVVSSMGFAPAFLTRTSEAAPAVAGFSDDRVLVVVQLGGGNDGLNTIVPYEDDGYYRARPKLGLRKERLIKISDGLAFNDSLEGLMRLYDNSRLAVVQSVGYPNPNRSHFRAMEIWHTASRSDEYLGDGWIGRYFDNHCSGAARPHVGVSVGPDMPQAFDGRAGYGIAAADPTRFGWRAVGQIDTETNFNRFNGASTDNETLDYLQQVTSGAVVSSQQVREACRIGGLTNPRDPLQTVAALIRGGLSTRVYYVSVSGFDTHADQLGEQDRLLRGVAESVSAFQTTLDRDGTADRVITMLFSEFGRRVAENASGGTDHGTAGPMFLVGKHVRPGVFGDPPNLSRLDDGDLTFSVDFRSVYGSILEGWFGVNPSTVLGYAPKALPVIG